MIASVVVMVICEVKIEAAWVRQPAVIAVKIRGKLWMWREPKPMVMCEQAARACRCGPGVGKVPRARVQTRVLETANSVLETVLERALNLGA